MNNGWLILSVVAAVSACQRGQPLAASAQPPTPLPAAVPLQSGAAAPASRTGDDRPVEPEPRERCEPYAAPEDRSGGRLSVPARRPQMQPERGLRLRTHVDGALSVGSKRTWIGPQVPANTPLVEGTAELFVLDPGPAGFLAFYRDPYDASSCKLSATGNCEFFAKHYDPCGELVWELPLSPFLSRPTQLEIQDIRLFDGTLYFNEACQTYSKDARGQCSALVAVDPVARRVVWRTPNLVSNGQFLVEENYIVTGYGFTAERDNLFVVRRSDGKVMSKLRVATAASEIVRVDGDTIEAWLYPGVPTRFRTLGWDTDAPRLERESSDGRRNR